MGIQRSGVPFIIIDILDLFRCELDTAAPHEINHVAEGHEGLSQLHD